MAKKTEKIIYWDTCVFLAWIKQEENKRDYLGDIEQLLRDNRAGNLILVTSQITRVELWRTNLDEAQCKLLDEALGRSWNIVYDVDGPVARKAHDIQTKFAGDPDEEKFPETPDALHIATAILARADEFHTFDDGKNNKKAKFPILSKTAHAYLDRLTICKPRSENRQLL